MIDWLPMIRAEYYDRHDHDRDIWHRPRDETRVRRSHCSARGAQGHAYTCLPDDDVTAALQTMKTHKIRRLPVVDAEGRVRGMLSLNDVGKQVWMRRTSACPWTKAS